jgi:Arc/MetJ-type ribon-helix-helix transcriptional regulator
MVMATIQIRLSDGLLRYVDSLVKSGMYSSRSDAIRDSVRKRMSLEALDRVTGILPDTGDSVKEIREIRKKLSKKIKSFEDMKRLDAEFRH